MPIALPIDSVMPAVLDALAARGAVVLVAPPGTGKTTRVPVAIAETVAGQVWVLEPRRIAARAAASRVAEERGEAVGEHVGYAMRLDRRAGPRTRVLYVTEALLGRRLAEDPSLQGIDAVVLDEFHERSVHVDVALAAVHALRATRPALRLVVMSATHDGAAVAKWLDAPLVEAHARTFPVEITHVERKDERPLEVRVSAAVRSIADGDVLVFLPGRGEIERAREALVGIDADVLPLHGELSGEEQDRALRAGRRRRIVLSTNVAETSVTVEGVRTVIDTGLARVAGHDPWSGLSTLSVEPISRASAGQRAGRAGRTAPGRCLRLYTKSDHDLRPADTTPEIRRVDLTGVVLDLAGRPLAWMDPPPPAAWKAAVDLLTRLGALDSHGRTAIGDAMSRLPAAPRVARMLIDAAERGIPREGAVLAALLEERRRGDTEDLVVRALDPRGLSRQAQDAARQLAGMLGRLGGERTGHAAPHGGALRGAGPPPQAGPPPPAGPPPQRDAGDALAAALLAGFPDRVGRRKGGAVVFAEGGSAAVEPGTPGGDAIVVVPEVERVGGRARVRSLTPIPADWLLDGADVRATLRWVGERVEATEQLCYGALVLDESLGGGDPAEVAALLWEHARPVAHKVFPDHERAAALVLRIAFLRRLGHPFAELDLDELGLAACRGCRSFGDLGAVSLVPLALARLGPPAAHVDTLAPEGMWLGARRRAPITYPLDGDPYISARMQEFFGLVDGPRIANGHALVLHLLAPNQRPVQVTRDLAGFWERHWPGIRKELMRRYPRHAWPDDPKKPLPEDLWHEGGRR
ncbi:MAG: ATP-dependent helicase HrpB [Pseudomonadota bacterium]|nr:ATP-dependent helicase HrpB [Pseudomonadota bacterium]